MHMRHHYQCGPSGRSPRRGGFGPFGWGGSRGGSGFPFGRMFRDGDLRLVALALIEREPRHGYEIIKALEERSAGFYSPSPGVVYPTLTYLEEAGYASSTSEGNKKVFAITEAGKTYLGENRDRAETLLEQLEAVGRRMSEAREWFDRPSPAPKSEAAVALDQARRRLRALIVAATEGTDADQQRVADILNGAADTILGKPASN